MDKPKHFLHEFGKQKESATDDQFTKQRWKSYIKIYVFPGIGMLGLFWQKVNSKAILRCEREKKCGSIHVLFHEKDPINSALPEAS